MVITKVTKNQADGSVSVELLLTEQQTMFLLNFAISYLIQTGTVTLMEQVAPVQADGQQAPSTEDTQQVTEFLQTLDPNKMGQA